VTTIPTGQAGSHMLAVSPNHRRAFVANIQSGTVSELDLAAGKKLRDLTIGTRPEGIALTPDGKQLWVSEVGGDAVHVFDGGSLRPLAKLATGKQPIRVAISPDGRTAVTSNFGDGTLSLFDTATLKPLRTISVSGKAESGQVTILFAPDGRRLYVAETGIDRVAEVDLPGGRVLRRLPAGKNGDGLAIVP
jgi:DNA-binding beta-propeller fold protein YncE